MSNRIGVVLLVVLCGTAAPGVVSTTAAQARASDAEWEVPRTPDGHPDLQGNWTNQSMTPIQRGTSQEGLVYTPEEVAEIEQGYVDRTVSGAQPSDPDRPPPPPKNTISAVDSYNESISRGVTGWLSSTANPGRRSSPFRPTARFPNVRQRARGGSRSAGLQGPICSIRPPGAETTRRTLPHFVRFPCWPPDAPQRGLQQQLHNRTDARSRDDHDGDGPRHADHSDG